VIFGDLQLYAILQFRDAAGRRVRNIPNNMANLLSTTTSSQGSLKGANVFRGVQHKRERWRVRMLRIGASTPLGVPPMLTNRGLDAANAGASYQWKKLQPSI